MFRDNSLSWNVTDSAGNAAGLGSRYFSIAGAAPSYVAGAGTTLAGSDTVYVYNDNVAKTVGTLYCGNGADCTITSCNVTGSNGGVTATPVNKTPTSHSVAVQADYTALPGVGTRTITCSLRGPDGSLTYSTALSVYDASPVVTSVERYDVPGDRLFVQGEGAVGVRILGHNFGKNPFNDTSRISVSGTGVTVRYITWWHDDGSEIDVVFNIDLTAPGPHTVTIASNGVSGLGFQPGGNPPSQSRGNGQIVVIVVDLVVSAQKRDHDDPASNGYTTLAPTDVLYGGSEDSTSDALTLTASFNPVPIPGATFTWSVTGPGSQNYLPPSPSASASTWSVGRIYPQSGNLVFRIDVQAPSGGFKSTSSTIEVGIRSDDVILVGWINASGVPLPGSVSGVESFLLQELPQDGMVTDSAACIARIGSLSINDDSTGPDTVLTPPDREYVLNWAFLFAANTDPSNVIPGDFRDAGIGFTSESKVINFLNIPTNYKLVNRLQVKYRVTGNTFNGQPVVLRGPLSRIGTTKNPCGGSLFPSTFDGQAGPANGLRQTTMSTRIVQVNDGSPDAAGVRVFNTLEGKNVSSPIFWENIGSKITFTVDGGPTPQIALQPYPTYYEYHNGAFVREYPEAQTPRLNFPPNPYPSGTVPCSKIQPDGSIQITPGGRCGDQASSPDITARIPSYVQP